ncbi:FCD domain-containing protein [Devosia algicola]|uniref:FCD domain-containing protein n=1 Tax=Devosia algicola TaxID=3026418 RepID=A0ABY7YK02_9HYPH|nr:FCD domain-containing protein [Devosia algicola]WDR01578.1 FCD domain-containing protein [Devosia algicola]
MGTKHMSQTERAVAELKHKIMSNELAPGSNHLEGELAELLGLSRTPVREAMLMLEAHGLVEVRPRHGMRVLPISAADMEEIYQILTELESLAAYDLAVRRPSVAELAPMRLAVDDMEVALKSDNRVAWAEADNHFHEALVDLAGNRRLKGIVSTYSDQAHRARMITLHMRPKPTKSNQDHRALLKAIEAGDAESARQIHRHHRLRAKEPDARSPEQARLFSRLGDLMADDQYEVFALKYAERNGRTRADSFQFDDDHASPHAMDYYIWVLRNHARTILVDTGYDTREATRRGRPILSEPIGMLKRLGIAPTDITDLIVTHLHYDHAGSLDQFEHARFHLQQAELGFAVSPCMCHPVLRAPFTAEHVCTAVKQLYSGKLTFHDGSAQIVPGVRVHRVGGHSSGLQIVEVDTANGPLILASDASHYYENFEREKALSHRARSTRDARWLQTAAGLAETRRGCCPRPRSIGASTLHATP